MTVPSDSARTSDGASPSAPGETPQQTVERNWNELLQEFRVIQTGTQILTGFLLTLPFQAKFSSLTSAQTTLYLCLVSGSALATALALTPVSVHRILFRHGEKTQIVTHPDLIAITNHRRSRKRHHKAVSQLQSPPITLQHRCQPAANTALIQLHVFIRPKRIENCLALVIA